MIKILIAEDDESLRLVTTMLLQSILKATVIEASNGKIAYDLLKAHPDIDLIICDYTMPIWGAEPFYQALKKDQIKIPFILFSGGGYEKSALFADIKKDNPSNGYLRKPVLKKDFEDVIRTAIPHKFT